MPDLICPDWPAPANIKAFTTTRSGGVSQGRWASFNLGEHGGDEPGAVAENRRRLQAMMPSAAGWIRQVHGAGVVQREAFEDGQPEADAVYSQSASMACTILTADCLPVLFCSLDGGRVAAAHAGWRGLLAGVLEATVDTLGVAPGRLMAWLGPAISGSAYEVGQDFIDTLAASDPALLAAIGQIEGRSHADLYQMARLRLSRAGLSGIYGGDFCTFTDPRFYSYRRDGQTGRMATTIWMT